MDYYCPYVLGKEKYQSSPSRCCSNGEKTHDYSLELAIEQQKLLVVECLLQIGVSSETWAYIHVNHYTISLNYYSHVFH